MVREGVSVKKPSEEVAAIREDYIAISGSFKNPLPPEALATLVLALQVRRLKPDTDSLEAQIAEAHDALFQAGLI